MCLWAFTVQEAALRNLNLSRQKRCGDMSAGFFSSGPTCIFFQAAPFMWSWPTEAPHVVADAGPLGQISWPNSTTPKYAKITFLHFSLAARKDRFDQPPP